MPEALSELVAQLLSNAPSQRPDAATPVRDTLRRLAQSTAPPSSAAQAPVGPALPAALIPAPAPWSLASLRQQLATPRGLAMAAAGLAVIVLLALIARCGCASPAADLPATASAPAELPAASAPAVLPAAPAVLPAASAPAVAPISAPPPTAPAADPAPAPDPVPAPVAAPVPAPADEPPLPTALAEPANQLLGKDAKARKRAAERVLAHQPAEDVPAYLRTLAALEKASSCAGKRGVLTQMDAAADARILPALRRLSATRRRGCGFFNSQDCYECLREPLARLIGRLEAAG